MCRGGAHPGAFTRRRAGVALVLLLGLCAFLPTRAVAEPAIADAPRRVASGLRDELMGLGPSPPPDLDDYGLLARSLVVYISGKPFLYSVDDLDRILGSPWELNDATRAKLDGLPPRLRLRLYSVLAGRLGDFRWEPPGARPVHALGGLPAFQIVTSEPSRRASVQALVRAVDGYFRAEEVADLVIWGLSRQAFFPRTAEGWEGWKARLVEYDLVVGTLGLAALAGIQQGNVKLGGWAYKTPSDSFRLGWYAHAKKVGFNGRPLLLGGVQAATPGFDAALGWSERVRPRFPDEGRALELIVREHWLSRLSRRTHWELASTLRGRYVWEHTVPGEEGAYRAQLDFYARRPSFIVRPEMDLLAEGTIGTNFVGDLAGDVSIGLEHSPRSVAGALRFSAVQDAGAATDYRIAVVIGGLTGERDGTDAFRELEDSGRRLREALRELEGIEERYCELASEASPGVPRTAALERTARWRSEAAARVRERSESYAEARRRCQAVRPRLAGPLTEEEAAAAEVLPGPLTLEEARLAREGGPAAGACSARAGKHETE